jgi:hypothetical protein
MRPHQFPGLAPHHGWVQGSLFGFLHTPLSLHQCGLIARASPCSIICFRPRRFPATGGHTCPRSLYCRVGEPARSTRLATHTNSLRSRLWHH